VTDDWTSEGAPTVGVEDVYDALAGAARSVNADRVEMRWERESRLVLELGRSGIESALDVSVAGGAARVHRDGGTGFCAFCRLSNAARAVGRAHEYARLAQPRRASSPAPAARADCVRPYPSIPAVQRDAAASLLGMVEPLLAEDIVLSVTARLELDRRLRLFVDGDGARLTQSAAWATASVRALVGDGERFRRLVWLIPVDDATGTPLDGAPSGGDLKREALEALRAVVLRPGRYDLVLHPEVTGLLIHEAVGHAAEADAHLEDRVLAGAWVPGRRVGVSEVSVVDDPAAMGGYASYGWDDQGVRARPTELVREGKVAARLHSLETAAAFDEEPTGNARAASWRHPPLVRMSATYLRPGSTPVGDLFVDTERGVYVRRAVAGETDGSRVVLRGTTAYMVERGSIAAPVAGVVIAGTPLELLGVIDLVGDDMGWGPLSLCHKEGQDGLPVRNGGPHVRLREVQLG